MPKMTAQAAEAASAALIEVRVFEERLPLLVAAIAMLQPSARIFRQPPRSGTPIARCLRRQHEAVPRSAHLRSVAIFIFFAPASLHSSITSTTARVRDSLSATITTGKSRTLSRSLTSDLTAGSPTCRLSM